MLCRVSKRVEEVILALDRESMTRLELMAKLGVGGGTVKKIVDWLLENGLAEEVPVSRYRVEVRLTEKGRRLAALIREIQSLLES